jgi:hypothetical protein
MSSLRARHVIDSDAPHQVGLDHPRMEGARNEHIRVLLRKVVRDEDIPDFALSVERPVIAANRWVSLVTEGMQTGVPCARYAALLLEPRISLWSALETDEIYSITRRKCVASRRRMDDTRGHFGLFVGFSEHRNLFAP